MKKSRNSGKHFFRKLFPGNMGRDSSFFSGKLFDFLEFFGWDYLVKVKLKNLTVPAEITRSGHQTKIKMYECHFYKVDWQELDRLVEAA